MAVDIGQIYHKMWLLFAKTCNMQKQILDMYKNSSKIFAVSII